jgi:hypothetical protein
MHNHRLEYQLSAEEQAPELDHPARVFDKNLIDSTNGCLLLVDQ